MGRDAQQVHLREWVKGAVHAATLGPDRLGRLAGTLAIRALGSWGDAPGEVIDWLFPCLGVDQETARRLLRTAAGGRRAPRAGRGSHGALDQEIELRGLCRDMPPLTARRYLADVLAGAVSTTKDRACRVQGALALACLARIDDRVDPRREPPTAGDVEFWAHFPFVDAHRTQGAMASLGSILQRADLPVGVIALLQSVLEGHGDGDDMAFVQRAAALAKPSTPAASELGRRPRGRPRKEGGQIDLVTSFVEKSGRAWSTKQLRQVAELAQVVGLRAVLRDAVVRYPERIAKDTDAEGDVVYRPAGGDRPAKRVR